MWSVLLYHISFETGRAQWGKNGWGGGGLVVAIVFFLGGGELEGVKDISRSKYLRDGLQRYFLVPRCIL